MFGKQLLTLFMCVSLCLGFLGAFIDAIYVRHAMFGAFGKQLLTLYLHEARYDWGSWKAIIGTVHISLSVLEGPWKTIFDVIYRRLAMSGVLGKQLFTLFVGVSLCVGFSGNNY